jgi:hypothetical protein
LINAKAGVNHSDGENQGLAEGVKKKTPDQGSDELMLINLLYGIGNGRPMTQGKFRAKVHPYQNVEKTNSNDVVGNLRHPRRS